MDFSFLSLPTAPQHFHLVSHDLRHEFLGRFQDFTWVDDIWTFFQEFTNTSIEGKAQICIHVHLSYTKCHRFLDRRVRHTLCARDLTAVLGANAFDVGGDA